MATTLLIKSNRNFMWPKILTTINSTGQCPYLLAKSCRLFSNYQKNLSMFVTPTTGDPIPSIFSAYQSFPVSYPMTISPPENYRVFISFRGDQLRHKFFSHLTDAFDRHNIKFFDDIDEQRGRDLKHLFSRIEESRIGLAIFSTRYPESWWCMSELVKMKKCANEGKLQIIPIFFKVDASDVRKPTRENEFGRNSWRLMESSDRRDPIQDWREALECTSNKMGLSLGDKSSESDFVKVIVKDVKRVNKAIRLHEEDNHGGNMKEKCRELQFS